MIVLDTSAVIAIYAGEPEAEAFNWKISSEEAAISAGTLIEISIVARRIPTRSVYSSEEWLDRFLATAVITIKAVTTEQAEIARAAYAKYGKGGGHPAQLNFGDCFSYALAKSLNVPLLYKGGDFAKTDIVSAL